MQVSPRLTQRVFLLSGFCIFCYILGRTWCFMVSASWRTLGLLWRWVLFVTVFTGTGTTQDLNIMICVEWMNAWITSSPGLWPVMMVTRRTTEEVPYVPGCGLSASELLYTESHQACEADVIISILQTRKLKLRALSCLKPVKHGRVGIGTQMSDSHAHTESWLTYWAGTTPDQGLRESGELAFTSFSEGLASRGSESGPAPGMLPA